MLDPDFRQLLNHYFDDALSAKEWETLQAYLSREEFRKQLREEIDSALYQNKFEALADEKRGDELFQTIMDAAGQKKRKSGKLFRLQWFRAAAAVIIFLIIGGGWLWYKHLSFSQRLSANKTNINKNDAAPGGNKATLTLSNGKVITLDSVNNGSLAKQGNTQVLKQNGKLFYNSLGADQSYVVFYNKVSTPRGGQLTLPDSTKVWLNAASSLKFPTAFTGKDREVTLTGEAYFEVARNRAKPFKVNVGKMQVQDLGTHFNINAYKDEPVVKTTLLEGAVSVSEGGNKVFLDPGQQAVIRQADNKISVREADVDEEVAWKDGKFSFHHTSIYEVMRQISRWYDVDVQFQDSLDVSLSGNIRRNAYASEVFKMLEVVGDAKFRIKGQKVIVTNK